MSLEYEVLKSLEHLKVQIAWSGAGRSKSWTGLIENDFSLSGSATYSSPYEELAQKLSGTLRGVTTAASSIAQYLPDSVGAQLQEFSSTQIKNPSMTAHIWEASERPPINVAFTMMNYKPGDDVSVDAMELLALCYPSLGSNGLYKAPGGYQLVGGGKQAVGTWSVRIGQWFQAFSLNLTSVELTFSQQQIADDPNDVPRPLTVTVSATLVPFVTPTEAQVQSYYVRGAG
ncbi:hypothetical protein NVP1031O_167 [Vibrio phage 1.031.O._10N.261.46.F8]|nr:hypothetical protein NVP1031O_167 [Vibrio phage 1.031.O._10N.261.46.F8]